MGGSSFALHPPSTRALYLLPTNLNLNLNLDLDLDHHDHHDHHDHSRKME